MKKNKSLNLSWILFYDIYILTRYTILQAGPVATAGTKDLKEISKIICKGSIDGERYRIGHSKIFFRAGKNERATYFIRFLYNDIFRIER